MEEIPESEFDKAVKYTLRVELVCGKVLLYHIDTENKNYLVNKLRENTDGDYDQKEVSFLWFKTSWNRYVIINTNEIARVIFCFDAIVTVGEDLYYDNFDTLEQTDEMKESNNKWFDINSNEDTPSQVIIYCKGKIADNNYYNTNPFIYNSLDEGCLSTFELELEGDMPFRQFVNLIDDDGEENFIPLKQIIVMELDANLIFDTENEKD